VIGRIRRGLDALVPRAGAPPRIERGDAAARLREALEAFLVADEKRYSKLFLKGRPVPAGDADAAWFDGAERAGIVRRGPLGVGVPAVRLFPLHGAFVATDLLAYDGEDQVFSLMLEQAYFVARMDVRPGDHVLELCVGSGVSALFASDRAARVVGVDVSERALAFAAFNTALNPGACAVELRKGSLWEPLAADERFDVILVNPPFELVPPGTTHFLHSSGGEDGLDVVRALLPGLPDRMRPGGRFEIVTWSPATVAAPTLGEDILLARLLAERFPGRRIELRVLDDQPLDRRIEDFRKHPEFAAWRGRLLAAGCVRVPLVWARVGDEPGGVEVREPGDELRACRDIVAGWR